jgi:hypothetical protein
LAKRLKGVNQAYTQTTYGSPENNSPEARYTLPPIYESPEANTPDPEQSMQTFGQIPMQSEKQPSAWTGKALSPSQIEQPRDTANFIRIQQVPDEWFDKPPGYFTFEMGDGVLGVRGKYQGKETLQTILFPKAKFTPQSAEAWVRSHGYQVGTGPLDPGHQPVVSKALPIDPTNTIVSPRASQVGGPSQGSPNAPKSEGGPGSGRHKLTPEQIQQRRGLGAAAVGAGILPLGAAASMVSKPTAPAGAGYGYGQGAPQNVVAGPHAQPQYSSPSAVPWRVMAPGQAGSLPQYGPTSGYGWQLIGRPLPAGIYTPGQRVGGPTGPGYGYEEEGGPGSGRKPWKGQYVTEADRDLSSQGYYRVSETQNNRSQQNYRMYRGPSGSVLIGHVNGVVNEVHTGKSLAWANLFKGLVYTRGVRAYVPQSEKMSEAHESMMRRNYKHTVEPSETGAGKIHEYFSQDGTHSVKFYENSEGMVGDVSVHSNRKEKAGWKEAYDWPHTIVFDWNGTIDARKTGQGIPWKDVQKLIDAGKNIVVFTSSVNDPDDKQFMRNFLSARGVKYTDDPTILDKADIFVGDKKSDRRRAGFHGVKYVDVTEFDVKRTLEKSVKVDVPPGMGPTQTVLPDGRPVTLSPQHDASGKYQQHTSQPVMVPTSELRVANPNQPLQPGKVQQRQARIENQGIQNLKPVAAWENGPGQPLTVTDGHHRLAAAQAEGKRQVPVVVLSRAVKNWYRWSEILNESTVYGIPVPTPEQASGQRTYPPPDTTAQDRIAFLSGVSVPPPDPENPLQTQSQNTVYEPGAGGSPNPNAGTYPSNPTPMQGPGDNYSTQAVMPKLQVQGVPAQVYGIRRALAQKIVEKAAEKLVTAEMIQKAKEDWISKPMGGYENWAACKRAGNSDAYCGYLYHHASPEGHGKKSMSKPGVDNTVIDPKWQNQTNIDPRQATPASPTPLPEGQRVDGPEQLTPGRPGYHNVVPVTTGTPHGFGKGGPGSGRHKVNISNGEYTDDVHTRLSRHGYEQNPRLGGMKQTVWNHPDGDRITVTNEGGRVTGSSYYPPSVAVNQKIIPPD